MFYWLLLLTVIIIPRASPSELIARQNASEMKMAFYPKLSADETLPLALSFKLHLDESRFLPITRIFKFGILSREMTKIFGLQMLCVPNFF